MPHLIEIACNCGKVLRVPMWRGGQRGKCTTCENTILVPSQDRVIFNPLETRRLPKKEIFIPTADVTKKRQTFRRTSRRLKGKKILKAATFALILAVSIVAIAAAGVALYPSILLHVPLEKAQAYLPHKIFQFLTDARGMAEYRLLEPKIRKLEVAYRELKAQQQKVQKYLQKLTADNYNIPRQKRRNSEEARRLLQKLQNFFASYKALVNERQWQEIELRWQQVSVLKGQVLKSSRRLEQDQVYYAKMAGRRERIPGRWYTEIAPVLRELYAFAKELPIDKREQYKIRVVTKHIYEYRERIEAMDEKLRQILSDQEGMERWEQMKKQGASEEIELLTGFMETGEIPVEVAEQVPKLQKIVSTKDSSAPAVAQIKESLQTVYGQCQNRRRQLQKALDEIAQSDRK